MSKLKKGKEHIVSIERLIEKYQHHPYMQGVKILKEKLAWFKNLEIRGTLLEESKSFKSI